MQRQERKGDFIIPKPGDECYRGVKIGSKECSKCELMFVSKYGDPLKCQSTSWPS